VFDFIPEQHGEDKTEVPYFDDVMSAGGWQGHSTQRSTETLKAEIIASVGRLGGLVTGFQRGTFVIGDQKREGFRIHYAVEHPDSAMFRGRIDIASLPVKDNYRLRRSLNARKDRSLKMALYMLRTALDGTWFLQQLSPGYAPLMPWMLMEGSGDKTITQLWSESAAMRNLLPPWQGDFIEAEFEEE
jgi:hypothetical protein